MSAEVIFDSAIQDRIENEVLANASDAHEKATAWLSYLKDQLTFPFQAKCIRELATSPLSVGELITVTGLDTEDYARDISVAINWHGNILAIPLSQIEGIDVNGDILQGITDWHYWIDNGQAF